MGISCGRGLFLTGRSGDTVVRAGTPKSSVLMGICIADFSGIVEAELTGIGADAGGSKVASDVGDC